MRWEEINLKFFLPPNLEKNKLRDLPITRKPVPS